MSEAKEETLAFLTLETASKNLKYCKCLLTEKNHTSEVHGIVVKIETKTY